MNKSMVNKKHYLDNILLLSYPVVRARSVVCCFIIVKRNLRRLQINVEKSSLVHVKSLFDVLISGQDLLEIVKNTIFFAICPVNISDILKKFHDVIELDPANGDSFIKPKFCEDFDKMHSISVGSLIRSIRA